MSCFGAYDTLHITGYTKYLSSPVTKDLVWCPEAQRKDHLANISGVNPKLGWKELWS